MNSVFQMLGRGSTPAQEASSDVSSDSGEPFEYKSLDSSAGVGEHDTTLDQLMLQSYMYSRYHPEFVQELEGANKQQSSSSSTTVQSPGFSLPTADSLGRFVSQGLRRNQDEQPSQASANTRVYASKTVQLQQGVLGGPDPATIEPVVVDWVKQERKLERGKERRRAQREAQQVRNMYSSYTRRSQQEVITSDSSEGDWSDDPTYDLFRKTMTQWERHKQLGKTPLGKKAPRAVLSFGKGREQHQHSYMPVPKAWYERCPDKKVGKCILVDCASTQLQSTDMKWRLPWLL